MLRSHPDLRWRRLLDGSLEVCLDGLAKPIAHAQRTPDGRWITQVWPLQGDDSRAAIAATQQQAVRWLRGWCRAYAWRMRPTVGRAPESAFGGPLRNRPTTPRDCG